MEYDWLQHLFIEVSAESDSFAKIINVGSNSPKLLGTLHSQLIDESVSVLLPEFYRDYHEEVMKTVMTNGAGLEHFSRNVLVRKSNH